ncbi:hypothetical protein [Bacillus pumilus]|uniref:hypothetical protein n=1 Tax=Bacillus pumilus TaxID=1408 RepID=UPI00119FA3B4|nr:hypothetical protein [Bacillus pumilus]
MKRLTFFCLILLISTILPQSNLSAISPSKFSVNENNFKDSYEGKLFSEKIIFNDSLIKYSYDFTDSEKNVVKIKEEGNNSETLVEFYNNTQTLFINGRKDENLKVSTVIPYLQNSQPKLFQKAALTWENSTILIT